MFRSHDQVSIRSVQALDDFRSSLNTFKAGAARPLADMEQIIRKTRDMLTARYNDRKRRVQQCSQAVSHAEAELRACQAATYRDRDGNVRRPDCSRNERHVAAAKRALQKTREALREVEGQIKMFERAAGDYQRSAARFRRTLNDEIPRANAYLGRHRRAIDAYLKTRAPAGSSYVPVASQNAASVGGMATSVADAQPSGQAAPSPGTTRIREIPLAEIDASDSHVRGPADFKKVNYESMREGMRKLDEVVRPAVERGADADYFRTLDEQHGVAYEHGYLRVYEAFYGDSAVTLSRRGDKYEVLNGFHRIFLAQQLGWSTIPVEIRP